MCSFKLASKTESYDDELSSVNNTPRIEPSQLKTLEYSHKSMEAKTKNEHSDEV